MREGEEGGGPGVQVGVPVTTRPRIQRKLACKRNSAAEDVGNIANAHVESTAAQGRRRLALAVVVGFGGGWGGRPCRGRWISATGLLTLPVLSAAGTPLLVATASIKTQGRCRVAPIRVDLGKD